MKLVKEYLNKEKNPFITLTFKELINIAPLEIQEILKKSKKVPQTLIWHPENWVYKHIQIVYNRAKRTGDINLMLAAFFHDMGKVFTTKKHPTISGKWSSPGHEVVSAKLVTKYSEWIKELEGDPEIVYYIVDQHMRVKQLPEMRPTKQDAIRNHKYFNFVSKFSDFDNMLIDYSNDLD